MADKMSQYSPLDAKVLKLEPMPDKESKWIRLNKVTYQDPTGKERTWESAERSTRPKGSECDGVGVVAILSDPRSKDGPSLLLQKQFRPPLNAVTIEVPAGLLDTNESLAECAIRELREETGYIATIPSGKESGSQAAVESAEGGFIMFNDPGFCNTNTKMVWVEVDMNDPRNQDPKPELEENEYIETFTIPLGRLWEELSRLDREGFKVDARVGTLAMGMEVARRWKGVFEK